MVHTMPWTDALTRLRERKRRLLVVLPHPDDESYGCAGLLARYGKDEDTATVFLCLTRGEASSMGPQRGITPDEVAAVRYERLERVQREVRLDALLPGTFPDSGLARHDLRAVARTITEVIDSLNPQVLVGHDPRGINAHADHIAAHWAIRHALLDRDIRFAMLAYGPDVVERAKPRLMFGTPRDQMHCVLTLTPSEVDTKERCLRIHDAIVTLFPEGPETSMLVPRPHVECFEFFGEPRATPVEDIFAGLDCE